MAKLHSIFETLGLDADSASTEEQALSTSLAEVHRMGDPSLKWWLKGIDQVMGVKLSDSDRFFFNRLAERIEDEMARRKMIQPIYGSRILHRTDQNVLYKRLLPRDPTLVSE